ncbi:MAG: heterodisulfide reductase-related iron-sulfur binding cluster, partial [Pseudomonadota bacterium]|nr:heterodisulfide reductase-related iron-sulfur binding cluster [Pseudomonadota bacterium]
LIDESETMELDGVDSADFKPVVDACTLCDMCFMTKCPYVPPHEWNVDFPHLMLRAKAARYKKEGTSLRNKLLANTDLVGSLAGIPVVAEVVNSVNHSGIGRAALDAVLGVHKEAKVPNYHGRGGRKRLKQLPELALTPKPAGPTTGKVALFTTCYGNYNDPQVVEDMAVVFRHNGIEVTAVAKEKCCGMPKLELGDLEGVAAAKQVNVPELLALIDQGYDIVAPVPSCVLMFKQELPLMFPGDADLERVQRAIFDPFEYLSLRHKAGELNTEFKQSLGKVAYHAACHQRVQNIGPKTREILSLVPDTEILPIERCSGHDGTYGVKKEFYPFSAKICRPVANQVKNGAVDHYGSDCPMAGRHVENLVDDGRETEHPLSLLRLAYGI